MTALNSNFRALLKKVLPPLITEAIRKRKATWFGNYRDWQTAAAECSGYNEDLILEKVDRATEQVVRGEFPYERDSVVFDRIEYSWPLLSALLWSHSLHGELNLIDFGGSLGSTYRQNIQFLKGLTLTWNVVEQKNFVALGQKKYQTDQLRFYESIQSCVSSTKANTLLISSTLQYLQDPMTFLKEIIRDFDFSIIILDRLSIISGISNRLTKQIVPVEIYPASYPCWFFSEEKILAILSEKYELIETFVSSPFNETYIDGTTRSLDQGYILKLKSDKN